MKLEKVLETCLYCQNLDAAEEFYTDILGLKIYSKVAGRHLFFKLAESMLLIFNPDKTMEAEQDVPPHGAYGEGHIAFAIQENEITRWKKALSAKKIAIEAEVTWPTGGVSLYFRDPANNSIELASPKIWRFNE